MKLSFNIKSAEVKVAGQSIVRASGVSTAYGIKEGVVSAKNKAASVEVHTTVEGVETAVKYEGASFGAEFSLTEVKDLAGKAKDFFGGIARAAKSTGEFVSESEGFGFDSVEDMYEPEPIPDWAVGKISCGENLGDFTYEVYDVPCVEYIINHAINMYQYIVDEGTQEDHAKFVSFFEGLVDTYLTKSEVSLLDELLEDSLLK